MKLCFVFGTRPEVIKCAPVIQEAKRRGHSVQVVFTGQHKEMALPLMEFFGIDIDINLDLMRPNQTLTSMSALLIQKLDECKDAIKADVILVQGDTTSAFVAGLWAFLTGIKVAHIEAGLRTYNLRSPFPEEANRQLLSKISDFHFAPTQHAHDCLVDEKVEPSMIFNVGNTSIDTLLMVKNKIEEGNIPAEFALPKDVIDFIGAQPFILVTGHRRESFGSGFDGICEGIKHVALARPDARILYPVHFNPQVREKVMKQLPGIDNVKLCDPVNYIPFVQLMRRADVILTDSGGVQEEAPTFRKPVVVMRETTERSEGVTAGFSVLVGTDAEKIEKAVMVALEKGCQGMGENPYGDGKTCQRIIEILETRI